MVKTLTWNCRRATQASQLWNYFTELSPDIALLQEVGSIPPALKHEYDFRFRYAVGKTGRPQRFGTALLVRGTIDDEIVLSSPYGWVRTELAHFSGNLLAYQITLASGQPLNAVNIYSPAWPIDRDRLKRFDVSAVKLVLNPNVWLADILFDALKHADIQPHEPWLVAGDFNLCETFDLWKGGPRGNREYLDRMQSVGLTECLRYTSGKLTPTFKKVGGERLTNQIDYIWVTQTLADALQSCVVGDSDRVFGCRLSDHLPIVADFALELPAEVTLKIQT